MSRSKSAAPQKSESLVEPGDSKSFRSRGKHGQMMDLLNDDDRIALNLNKYEQAYTVAEL